MVPFGGKELLTFLNRQAKTISCVFPGEYGIFRGGIFVTGVWENPGIMDGGFLGTKNRKMHDRAPEWVTFASGFSLRMREEPRIRENESPWSEHLL